MKNKLILTLGLVSCFWIWGGKLVMGAGEYQSQRREIYEEHQDTRKLVAQTIPQIACLIFKLCPLQPTNPPEPPKIIDSPEPIPEPQPDPPYWCSFKHRKHHYSRPCRIRYHY